MYEVNSRQQQLLAACGGLDLVLDGRVASLFDIENPELILVARLVACELEKRGYSFPVNHGEYWPSLSELFDRIENYVFEC